MLLPKNFDCVHAVTEKRENCSTFLGDTALRNAGIRKRCIGGQAKLVVGVLRFDPHSPGLGVRVKVKLLHANHGEVRAAAGRVQQVTAQNPFALRKSGGVEEVKVSIRFMLTERRKRGINNQPCQLILDPSSSKEDDFLRRSQLFPCKPLLK